MAPKTYKKPTTAHPLFFTKRKMGLYTICCLFIVVVIVVF